MKGTRATGLHVHGADRTDRLADGLADLLARPGGDPLATEMVVVPAKGVERWLTQRLSHCLGVGPRGGDGVCAGVDFRSPHALVATLTGTEATDPWDPDRLVWPVLAAVDASMDQPWCATLARHLGEGHEGEQRELRRGRRWSVARRLAGLFAAYGVQRPTLLEAWSAGADGDGITTGGVAGRLPADLLWQAELWRVVEAAVDAPPPQVRHRDTLAAIRAGRPLGLPDRLSLFGHTRLPVTEVELVRAVAEVREVHLWLPMASSALWRSLGPAVAEGPVLRSSDDSAARVSHPLLSSLGRDTRELQRSLTALGEVDLALAEPTDGPPTLLGWLQSDLRRDREPDERTRAGRVVGTDDRSVGVHAAHGAARQVEVLREVLVGLLEDDPTLEPRDILVMCPDVEAYAPLFRASFGLGSVVGRSPGPSPGHAPGHPAQSLRLRLADRGLARTNPFLAVATSLVTIAAGRATLSQVLDLAASAPVRHRFGLGDDDLDTIATWAEDAGVRWGLTAPLRDPYGLARFPQNTWRAGLDRLLVGVAMSEGESMVGPVLPLDDVPSADVELAGRLAELVDRVEDLVRGLLEAQGLAQWMTVLREGVLSLGSAPPSEAWQVAQFERELASVAAGASSDASDTGGSSGSGGTGSSGSATGPRLRLPDLRAMLERRSGARPTRANFRTGSLTVCTMVPMRSVPHRVVCLVGLDDGTFPRASSTDGDDVLARSPMTGERDVRSEDRQLLLDAVLAASERLVVTYAGAHEVTGHPRPPAVPLGELLDALEQTAVGAEGGSVLTQVVTRHPLQAYDPRNLVPEGLHAGVPGGVHAAGSRTGASFSFDRAALAGARAVQDYERKVAAGDPPRRAPFLAQPLAARPVSEVSLKDLQDFFAHPARAFLRRCLDVAVAYDADEPDDGLPLDLDGLEKWAIGDRMLRRLLEGVPIETVIEAELARGELPPGLLAKHLVDDVLVRARDLAARSGPLRLEAARSVEVTVVLDGGRQLTGVVPGVRGERLVRVGYSSLSAKARLATWVDLVALTAAHPDTSWCASTVGWFNRAPRVAELKPLFLPPGDLLADLVDTFDRGQREPIPLPVRAAAAYAGAGTWRSGDDGARGEWDSSDSSSVPGEQQDGAHRIVHRGVAGYADLRASPRPGESWNDEPHRLGRYARRLWAPVLEHETQKAL